MRRRFWSGRGVALGATIALLIKGPLLAAAVTWSAETLRDLDGAHGSVSGTHAVIGETEALLEALTEAEAGQQGFLLTGDTAQLIAYQNAMIRVGMVTNVLGRLALEDPDRTARLPALWRVADAKQEDLSRGLQQRQAAEAEATAMTAAQLDRGRRLMAEVRQAAANFQAAEWQVLQHRLSLARNRVEHALLGLAVAGLTVLGLTLIGAVSFRRAIGTWLRRPPLSLSLAQGPSADRLNP